jgi:predicted nuclease with TOPRIM domain
MSNDIDPVHALQKTVDQLRHDLQMKTDELEKLRQRTEKKRSSIAAVPNESIEQAMHLQSILNARLEEMLIENDLLKKSIYELESYVQQQQQQQQQQACKSFAENIIRSSHDRWLCVVRSSGRSINQNELLTKEVTQQETRVDNQR